MLTRNRKWLIAVVLVLLGGILLFVAIYNQPTLPPVMFLPPVPLVVRNGRVPERWFPIKWLSMRRACRSVFGTSKQVGFTDQIISTSEAVDSFLAQNTLGPPQAESNGLAIWFLPKSIMKRTMSRRDGLATIRSDAPISRADWLQEMHTSIPSRNEGYIKDLFLKFEKETADLSTRLIATSDSEKKTNFVAALRVQLPYGKALFVLGVRQPEAASNRIGFLIAPDEYDTNGNVIQRPVDGK